MRVIDIGWPGLRIAARPLPPALSRGLPRRLPRIASLGLLLIAVAGCSDPAMQRLDADAANGRLLLRQFGCGECHTIPGVVDARGNVGPPLTKVARRTYLAGRVPNRPETMAQWIRDPQRFDPMTRMPDLQVSEAHARDMVAYLFTLD
ncbi:MAG: c-type cytochrome [Burkholderiaceae bacterium]|nr:c-type cytochrome [Burkholderiaceae bacterium]